MKTALITGANVGIGLATAKALARRGFNLILLCRNEAKGREALTTLQRINPAVTVQLVLADLTDTESIRRAAEQVKATHSQLDVLINNAGYSPDRIEFVGSIEKSFFANHIGHFVLTYHLLDLLKAAGEARVINLSSAAYMLGKASRFFQHDKKLSLLAAYGDGKLANVLFTRELATRYADSGITAYAVHPGVVKSNFGSNFTGPIQLLMSMARPFMRSPERGAETSVYLATAPIDVLTRKEGKAGGSGGFFADSAPKLVKHVDNINRQATDLWEKSMAFV
ncbi:SDR family NAD(P)-dependent oxidoreductase [Spirosoma fluviale]|uniref:NAD(P)-dependent dehydrogenase, short-chain alcohol dehydrogenase family n=1 Tax=Spirosoma fluviale TaxID=1597977 RepID=A0A286G6X2_9BACT|nr:SDR family NAD(P)-dependent oxidoreductase [Spirosoma fluviale]SOD90714.1 NAD(P)-dependent dehydrogenase, short-chain alcohol dehydrogenase family [Spirosoma fluviale]